MTLIAVGGLALSMAAIAGLANAAPNGFGGPPQGQGGFGPPGTEQSAPPTPPEPAPDGELQARVVDGVQIYRCNGGTFAQFNVRATLEGDINHFFESDLDQPDEKASPVWEVAGGRVVGSAPQATPNGEGNIPLLSLTGTGSGGGPLSTVTQIQRLETAGGVAPAGPCTDGEIAEVPYNALYVFTS